MIIEIKVRALVKTDNREPPTTKVLELLHLLFQAVLESLVDEMSMNSDFSHFTVFFPSPGRDLGNHG